MHGFDTLRTNSSWACALVLCLMAPFTHADSTVDPQELIRESQRIVNQDHRMTFVWWVPSQFWRLSLEKEGQLAPKAVDGFVKVVAPYTILLVSDGNMGTMGGLTYVDTDTLRKSVSAKDSTGKIYAPLEESKLEPNLANFLQMMGPLLSNTLGPFGKNMHFIVFATSAHGVNVIDAEADGKLVVNVADREFAWRLPLGSLLPRKVDAKSGEQFPGNFLFNPFTGDKLSAAPAH